MINLYNDDCLKVLPTLADKSIDLILTDLPYGTTACKWDVIIPFDIMWREVNRIIKPNSAIIFFGSDPFSSSLIASNIQNFKHKWIWNKKQSGSFANAKYGPLKITEDVIVFSKGKVSYNPIMRKGKLRKKGGYQADKYNEIQSGLSYKNNYSYISDEYYPINILEFSNANKKGRLHPTQKPVALLEYLIKTYSNENNFVLDFTMGSGSCGVASINLNRNFIGIELDKNYFNIAEKRILEVNHD